MLKMHYINGSVDSQFEIDPALLSKPLGEFVSDATVQSLKAGRLVTVNAAGHVALSADGSNGFAGFLVNDVAGYGYENVPAYASGKAPVCIGGGLVETDQVVNTDIKAGDYLYCVDGLLTNVAPANGVIFGQARTANSAVDKTVTVYF